jgi:tetratricopeptide (TPR) repeat protein
LAVLPQVREAVLDFVKDWSPQSWLASTLLPDLEPQTGAAQPLSARDLRDAIVAFFEQGAFRSALKLMDRLPEESRSPQLETLRAEMLALTGHWDEAMSLYQSLGPDAGVDEKLLSTTLAMYDLETALLISRRLGNQDSSYRLVTANILYHLRRHEEALAELRELSIESPQVDQALTTVTSSVLLEMGALQRTVSYLEDRAAMTRRPEDYALLGRAISAQGRSADALVAFDKGYSRSRHNPSANFWRTQERIKLGLVDMHALPSLEGSVPEVSADETVVFFAADSSFFWRHGLTLIGSVGRSAPNAPCHVHVINPDSGIAHAIERTREILPNLRLSYSYEHVNFVQCSDLHIRTYYASVRFVRLAEIFGRSPASYLCVDADSIVRGDITASQAGGKVSHVGLHVRYHEHPQMAVLASASLFRPNAAAARFIDRVSELIKTSLESCEAVWFLDQIVLGHVVRELGADGVDIALLDLTYLDWFFRDESLVWTGKGKRKSDDSRYRGEVAKFRYLQTDARIMALMPPDILGTASEPIEDELA